MHFWLGTYKTFMQGIDRIMKKKFLIAIITAWDPHMCCFARAGMASINNDGRVTCSARSPTWSPFDPHIHHDPTHFITTLFNRS